ERIVPPPKKTRVSVANLYTVELIDDPVSVDVFINHISTPKLMSGSGTEAQVFRRDAVCFVDDIPLWIPKLRICVDRINPQRPVRVETANNVPFLEFR